jgi:hypothetical protein
MSLCQVGVGDGNGGFILPIGRLLEGVREGGMKLGMKEVKGGGKIKKSEERGGPWIIINTQGNKSECGVCPRRRSYDAESKKLWRPRERRS